jgi:hypothetical protein
VSYVANGAIYRVNESCRVVFSLLKMVAVPKIDGGLPSTYQQSFVEAFIMDLATCLEITSGDEADNWETSTSTTGICKGASCSTSDSTSDMAY